MKIQKHIQIYTCILLSIIIGGYSHADETVVSSESCANGQTLPAIITHKQNITTVLNQAVLVSQNAECNKKDPSFFGTESTLFLLRHLDAQCTNPFRTVSETFFYFEQSI